jgi:hypothetical protein
MRFAALLFALALGACEAKTRAPAETPRPDLALLTSLPIAFGESFGLDQQRSPLLDELEASFSVRPVDGPEQLRAGGLLLAIQPQALTAERLVALDKWVRGGGRLLLLADAHLGFESGRPLGDRFRPPYSYPDTGLLAHWGLVLTSDRDSRMEQVEVDLGGGTKKRIAGMGRLERKGGSCVLTPAGEAARCPIGKGQVIVVADADFAMSPEAGRDDQKAVVRLLRELEGQRTNP